MTDFSIIGKPVAMVDAAGKTTGAGKYTDDLSVPGMLVGKILHSPYPHARITRIDTSRAEALEGVIAIATGKDAPKTYGILPVGHDETALAVDKVRYIGDNVACVAASLATVAELEDRSPELYTQLYARGERLMAGFRECFIRDGGPSRTDGGELLGAARQPQFRALVN